MRNWDRNQYVAQCNLMGAALQKLIEVHNKLAEECRDKFGDGPEDLLMTGYEE